MVKDLFNSNLLSYMRISITILIFFLFNLTIESQNAEPCLSDSQLRKLQTLPYNSVHDFLFSQGWSRNEDYANQTRRYFGYDLDYSVAVWQRRDAVFIESKLYLYYKSGKPNLLVYQAINECFEGLLNELPQNLYKRTENSELIRYYFPHRDGIIFDIRNYKNDNSSARFSILLFNESSLSREISLNDTLIEADILFKEGRYEEAIGKYKSAEKILVQGENGYLNQILAQVQKCIENINSFFISNTVIEGDRYFRLNEYSAALLNYELAYLFFKTNPSSFKSGSDIENKISRCYQNINRVLIEDMILEGDWYFKQKEFKNALVKYEQARLYFISNPSTFEFGSDIEDRIEKCNENINRVLIENFISEGDSQFELKEYLAALSNYEKALLYYNSNPYKFEPGPDIEARIDKTNEILMVIDMQKTEQSYLSLNPSEFRAFRDNNYEAINSLIYKFKKSGNINFKSIIEFDTLGNNYNQINIESSSSNRVSTFINTHINTHKLTPIVIHDRYIPTRDTIQYKISWNSYSFSARARSSRIKIVPVESRISDFQYNIESFINKQNFKNGIYEFLVINKNINETSFDEVSLIKYRNNSGPLNSVFSLVLPGWGTQRVTNGDKGRGKMNLFLLASIISIGSKIYSDYEYDKYLVTNYELDALEHYDLANTANKVFLISGGIAATIYIHDFFWVFGKGIKNNKLNKEIKIRLKSDPLKIVESPAKTY